MTSSVYIQSTPGNQNDITLELRNVDPDRDENFGAEFKETLSPGQITGPHYVFDTRELRISEGDAHQTLKELSASEALFAFAGWLTSSEGMLSREGMLGSGSDGSSTHVADLVNDFCKSQGFAEPREGWHNALKVYPDGTLPAPIEEPTDGQ